MYSTYFNLRGKPFQLVPDPAYLYLSKSHEEALAHLAYAVNQGDGFVEITGEVGTGKSLLCRVFFKNSNTDADNKIIPAYIFNPKLNSIELLKAVNDEFGISSQAGSLKDLIDVLNTFLLEQAAEGHKVILCIDEAQNLSKEVLEQLRLLSNLETTKSKLIQIILVGQPELHEMLHSYELRQLGQRITLNCHLLPLNPKETKKYIGHRINIASLNSEIRFTGFAHRMIYRYTNGIPRLINILCDRILLTAYCLDKKKITTSITKSAIKELSGRWNIRDKNTIKIENKSLILINFCMIVLMLVSYRTLDIDFQNILGINSARKSEKTAAKPKADITKTETGAEKVSIFKGRETTDLKDFLNHSGKNSYRGEALKAVLALWVDKADIKINLEKIRDNQLFFMLGAKQHSLLTHRTDGTIEFLKKLNLPAVIEITLQKNNSVRYLAVENIDSKEIRLRVGDKIIKTDIAELETFWRGRAIIFWKNFFSYPDKFSNKTSKEAILTLKYHLQDIGFDKIKINTLYDKETKKAIKTVQRRHSLDADGIVGPLTKIVLYNEKKSLSIPHITGIP